jgi:DNA-binding LacI/PurR family transcriptional regulator
MAIQAMLAAADAGLRIPEDVSVIGLDDISLATRVRPKLTTIALPKREIARVATRLLLRLIAKEDIAPAEAQITLLPQLVVRDSTAPPFRASSIP